MSSYDGKLQTQGGLSEELNIELVEQTSELNATLTQQTETDQALISKKTKYDGFLERTGNFFSGVAKRRITAINNTKPRNVTEFNGIVSKKKLDLNISITEQNVPRVKVTQESGFAGALTLLQKLYFAAVELLPHTWRFVGIRSKIWIERISKVTIAPAADCKADEAVVSDNDISLSAHDATEMEIDQNTNPLFSVTPKASEAEELLADSGLGVTEYKQLLSADAAEAKAVKVIPHSVLAKFRAYVRAPLTFIKTIPLTVKAKFLAASGFVFKHTKVTKEAIKAKLIDTKAALIKIGVGLLDRPSALVRLVKANCAKYEEVFIVGKVARAIAASLEMVTIRHEAYTAPDMHLATSDAKGAKANTSIDADTGTPSLWVGGAAEATADNVVALSLLARLVAYVRAPILHLKRIWTGCDAEATTADGAEMRGKKTTRFGISAFTSLADSIIFRSKKNVVQSGVDATAYFAPAREIAPTTSVFVAEVFGEAVSAPARDAIADELCEPEILANAVPAPAEDVNVQAETDASYSAKIVYCFEPFILDGYLHILQVFSGVQNLDCLEIDCEEESVYWANAIVDGDCLCLTFANEVTQENDKLGVI